jgi:uncharacterized protein (DUF1697 family)
MATCIAFFRGINVGGRNRLAMKDLVQQFERIGIHGARTHIQSGNVAFRCTRQQRPEIARRIAAAIQQEHGFEPKVQVITIQELEHAVAANPFMDARKDPSNLHLWFLKDVPESPDIRTLDELKTGTERFALDRKVFYLHAPDGFGDSKLAAAVEKCLGIDATSRNWQTVTKTLELGWDLA